MLKNLYAIALIPLALMTLPAHAQTTTQVSDVELQANLQEAVCQNDWNEALEVIDPLIGSSQTSPAYRSELVSFRRQVENWRDTRASVSNISNCPVASAVANTTPTQPRRPQARFDWSREIMAFPELLDMPVGIARTDECLMLAGLISQAGTEAQTISQAITPGDPAPFVQLIGLVDRTSSTMQRLRITDGRLQGLKQRFISTYSTMGDASRNLVESANEQDSESADRAYEAIVSAAGQEQRLIDETVQYCGQR
ncbi:MAG: hypothetical protein SFY66_24935 [Oculatellaceae cyanobacterium bins.114]|nr:hypothetical protein [Oculatellaceae cyanobacterium bins.114]